MSLRALCSMLREIRDSGPVTVADAARVFNCHPATAWHRIRVMSAEGVLHPVGRRGGALLWGLAPAGTAPGKPYVREKRQR